MSCCLQSHEHRRTMQLAVLRGHFAHGRANWTNAEGLSTRPGAANNTIVVFTSDHGLAIGSHGLRGKQNMYEHTIGVPLIVRGPGVPAGKQTAAQCYLRDLYPTLCEFAGVPAPDDLDGRSLAAVFRDTEACIHDAVFTHFGPFQRGIRTAEWKYIVYPQADREQLFHLGSDPDEIADLSLSADRSAVRDELRARLTGWRKSWQDPTLPAGN
ncbi:MAG: sulfatase-like hydrolase/transferase [Planctomycetaceae bacterium]